MQDGQCEAGTAKRPRVTKPANGADAQFLKLQETLGERATRVAEEKARAWLSMALPVTETAVLEAAERGLFHCQMRFEDDVPKDPVNQQRMRKVLAKQGIACSFTCSEFDVQRVMPGNVTMKLHWGPQVEAQIALDAEAAAEELQDPPRDSSDVPSPPRVPSGRCPGTRPGASPSQLFDAPSSFAVC